MRYQKARFGKDPAYKRLLQMRKRVASMLMQPHRRGREVDMGHRRTSTCMRLCGCRIEEMREALEAKFYDREDGEPMLWENYGKGAENWVLDHIKPVCLFDWWTTEGLKEAFHHSNTQPLWYADHKAKTVEDLTLARLRRLNDPEYGKRVEGWRVTEGSPSWDELMAAGESLTMATP